eukprot:2695260-Rhodomonas_salina.1
MTPCHAMRYRHSVWLPATGVLSEAYGARSTAANAANASNNAVNATRNATNVRCTAHTGVWGPGNKS